MNEIDDGLLISVDRTVWMCVVSVRNQDLQGCFLSMELMRFEMHRRKSTFFDGIVDHFSGFEISMEYAGVLVRSDVHI